jgi:hypothetical protein
VQFLYRIYIPTAAPLAVPRFVLSATTELLKNIRTEVLIKLIKPYTRIKIPFISRQLKIKVDEVEALLVSCVLDGQVLIFGTQLPPNCRLCSLSPLPPSTRSRDDRISSFELHPVCLCVWHRAGLCQAKSIK